MRVLVSLLFAIVLVLCGCTNPLTASDPPAIKLFTGEPNIIPENDPLSFAYIVTGNTDEIIITAEDGEIIKQEIIPHDKGVYPVIFKGTSTGRPATIVGIGPQQLQTYKLEARNDAGKVFTDCTINVTKTSTGKGKGETSGGKGNDDTPTIDWFLIMPCACPEQCPNSSNYSLQWWASYATAYQIYQYIPGKNNSPGTWSMLTQGAASAGNQYVNGAWQLTQPLPTETTCYKLVVSDASGTTIEKETFLYAGCPKVFNFKASDENIQTYAKNLPKDIYLSWNSVNAEDYTLVPNGVPGSGLSAEPQTHGQTLSIDQSTPYTLKTCNACCCVENTTTVYVTIVNEGPKNMFHFCGARNCYPDWDKTTSVCQTRTAQIGNPGVPVTICWHFPTPPLGLTGPVITPAAGQGNISGNAADGCVDLLPNSKTTYHFVWSDSTGPLTPWDIIIYTVPESNILQFIPTPDSSQPCKPGENWTITWDIDSPGPQVDPSDPDELKVYWDYYDATRILLRCTDANGNMQIVNPVTPTSKTQIFTIPYGFDPSAYQKCSWCLVHWNAACENVTQCVDFVCDNCTLPVINDFKVTSLGAGCQPGEPLLLEWDVTNGSPLQIGDSADCTSFTFECYDLNDTQMEHPLWDIPINPNEGYNIPTACGKQSYFYTLPSNFVTGKKYQFCAYAINNCGQVVKKCAPVICENTTAPCICAGWDNVTVTWSGAPPETWTGQCGENLTIPWANCGTAVKTISSVSCNCSQSQLFDVYFLADSTVSMENVIDQVQSGSINIMDSLHSIYPSMAFGVGNYRDFEGNHGYCFQPQLAPIDYLPDYNVNWNAHRTKVIAKINDWATTTGGDPAEGQLYALYRLAKDPGIWRPGAKHIIVWFGDNPGHDPICPCLPGMPAYITENITLNSVIDKLVANNNINDINTVTVLAISVNNKMGYGFNYGLDADPTAISGGYADLCNPECTPDGEPGQASSITKATGGKFADNINTTEICSKIIQVVNDYASSYATHVPAFDQFTPSSPGVYPVKLNAACDNQSCPPCDIKIQIRSCDNCTSFKANVEHSFICVCENGTITLNGSGEPPSSTATYTWTAPNNKWDGPDHNIVYTGPYEPVDILYADVTDSGIYTLTVTDTGCSDTATVTVIVSEKPAASITVEKTSSCPMLFTLTGEPDGMDFYIWTDSNGVPVSNEQKLKINATSMPEGDYPYTLTVVDTSGCKVGCTDNATAIVPVHYAKCSDNCSCQPVPIVFFGCEPPPKCNEEPCGCGKTAIDTYWPQYCYPANTSTPHPAPACKCQSWDPGYVSWTDPSGPHAVPSYCNASFSNVYVPSWTPGTEVVENSTITCAPGCSLPTYSWTVQMVLSGIWQPPLASGNTWPAHFAPSIPGFYVICENATCGSTVCERCCTGIQIGQVTSPSPCSKGFNCMTEAEATRLGYTVLGSMEPCEKTPGQPSKYCFSKCPVGCECLTKEESTNQKYTTHCGDSKCSTEGSVTRQCFGPALQTCSTNCQCLTQAQADAVGFTEKDRCQKEPCAYEKGIWMYCYPKLAPTKPIIEFFNPSRTQVTYGEPVTLSYRITGADNAWLTCGGEKRSVSPTSGSITTTPPATGCCTLTAINKSGEAQKTQCITVTNRTPVSAPVINSFTANCTTQGDGSAIFVARMCTLSWSVTGPSGTSVTITNIGTVGLSGSTQVPRGGTYTITATGPNGSKVTRTVTAQ